MSLKYVSFGLVLRASFECVSLLKDHLSCKTTFLWQMGWSLMTSFNRTHQHTRAITPSDHFLVNGNAMFAIVNARESVKNKIVCLNHRTVT